MKIEDAKPASSALTDQFFSGETLKRALEPGLSKLDQRIAERYSDFRPDGEIGNRHGALTHEFGRAEANGLMRFIGYAVTPDSLDDVYVTVWCGLEIVRGEPFRKVTTLELETTSHMLRELDEDLAAAVFRALDAAVSVPRSLPANPAVASA